jgi:hypothetical protein
LKIPERYNLPEIGAIYFVLSANNEIEYIGKAKKLRKHWRSHECCMNLDSPKTCRVAWFEVLSEDERTQAEKQLIRKFNPKLNANFITKIKPKSCSKSLKISFMTDKVSTDDLMTPSQIAKEMGVSRQWIYDLLKRDKIETVTIAGRIFVKRSEILNREPENAGRPPKRKMKNN